jgi:glycosyltransferase involved in cell wall biosynthesis
VVAIDKSSVDTTPRSKLPGDLIPPGELTSQADLVVIIPAYNEARFIGSVVLQARRFTDQVIVVDDGSTDDTAQIARSAGVTVVSHECNQGKGGALNTGFRTARQFDPQVVVCLDGDGQHLPNEIDLLIEPIIAQEADIVVGSRYMGTFNQVPRHRVWGHQLFNLLTRYASGVESSDSQSGFRAFSPRALQAISFCSQDFSVESEMQFLAQEHDLRVVEVPITIRYMRVLNGVLRLIGQHRPLFYFGVPGMFLLVSGIAWGIWVVERFNQTHQLAVGTALVCVLLSVFGLILLSTGIILHSVRGLLLDLFRQNQG